jgi:hypothetical protein
MALATHPYQQEQLLTEEDQITPTAEFEPGSSFFFFCQSKQEHNGVLAQEKQLCEVKGCLKAWTKNPSWC